MGIFSIRKTKTDYYNTGEIESIYQTLNNQIDGWLKMYHKNGQLKVITNYKKGIQLDEIIKSYDETGNLIRTVEFKNGFLNGPFKEYYSSGKIKTEGIYSNNVIIDKKAYYENSILKYHYIKSENEIESKIFDEDLNYLKNNLDQLPKFSVLYTSNNDFENFLFNTYESALIKFESISNKILDISKEYEINEINNPDFIELVELCELLEIPQKNINSIISIEEKNELIELWLEIHSESSHRYLSKFTSLINNNIELREFEGRTYFNFSNLNQNINYIPIEFLHTANSENFIEHKKLIDTIKYTKDPTLNGIESAYLQSEFKNLFIILNIFVSYYENKLAEDNYRIDKIIEKNIASDINIIFDFLYRNEIKDFNISDLMNKLMRMQKNFHTEVIRHYDSLKDTVIEDIKIAKAYYYKANFNLLLNKIISDNHDLNLFELNFVKYQKNVSTSTIVDRLIEINDINTSNYINYNKLENLLKSILLDIENDNILDGYIKDDLLCFDYNSESKEISIENLYFDYFTSLYYQEKNLSCLVAGEHLINKFPNTNNSNLFGILGELHMQISSYDKAAIYYNLCITNLFNENYSTDFSSQILHFCNRAQSFLKLFEDENQYINNIINDLNIYMRYYPNDKHVKDLYNKMKYLSDSVNENSGENDFVEEMGGIISNLINEGKEDVAKQILSDLFLNSEKKEIQNRILKSKIFDFTSDNFFEFLSNSKKIISASVLSNDLKITLIDSIDYFENIKYNDNNIDKKIDLVYVLESAYNNEIFINFIQKNKPSEGLKHIEILIKLLSYFIEESTPNVYDTIANLYLLNNRLIEAEVNIIKCLQIETVEDDESPDHNFTAAKIYYKKNDLINGLKYYNKAIELGADEVSIIEFQQFLKENNLKINK